MKLIALIFKREQALCNICYYRSVIAEIKKVY